MLQTLHKRKWLSFFKKRYIQEMSSVFFSNRKEDISSSIGDIMILQQFVQSNSLCWPSPVRLISGADTHGAALRVTDMSEAISASESATSSLCERRQHPSTLHENNLPALFNLHTSSPGAPPPAGPRSPVGPIFALPPKLTQMRRGEIVISPRLCMKIKLGIAFVLDSLPCKQRSCFLIFM